MIMFLTEEDLQELTDATLRRLQIAWLESHGWTFELSRLGRPKVLRAYAERRLGLDDAKKSDQTEPDFSHWDKAA